MQRLANHLQHLGGHFLRQPHGGVGSQKCHRNAAFLLEGFGGAPGRGHQAGAIQVDRTHAMQEDPQVADLGLRQRLQLHKVLHARLEIALQKLAQDLETHLQTDEALQRAIVKVRRDSLALRLAGFLRILLHFLQLFAQLFDVGFVAAFVHRATAGQGAGHQHTPGPVVGQDGAEDRGDGHHHHHLHRPVERQSLRQEIQEKY